MMWSNYYKTHAQLQLNCPFFKASNKNPKTNGNVQKKETQRTKK